MSADVVFAVCLGLGVVLALLSLLLAGHGGHGAHVTGHLGHGLAHLLRLPQHLAHGAGKAAHAASQAGHAAAGAGHVAAAAGSPLVPTWLMPFILSASFCLFGGSGLVARQAQVSPILAVAIALVITAVVAAALVFGLGRTLASSEAAGYSTGASLVGCSGRVSVAIPAGAIGAVAYVNDGRQSTMPARSSDDGALEKGAAVVIIEIENHVARVEPC